MSLQLAGNYYATRAHYTEDLLDIPVGGKRGLALCSTPGNQVDVYNQAALDESMFRGEAKKIEWLPLCKRCERKASAREVVADA